MKRTRKPMWHRSGENDVAIADPSLPAGPGQVWVRRPRPANPYLKASRLEAAAAWFCAGAAVVFLLALFVRYP